MAVAAKVKGEGFPLPTMVDLKKAHSVFLEKEARDLFYTVATDLVARALDGKGPVGLGGAVAVLLATWNRRFYQRGRRCDRGHVDAIDERLSRYRDQLTGFGRRGIETLSEADRLDVEKLFARFEPVLGRVGVAKCFHLMAPCYFPLWDNTIAANYHLPLSGWNNSNRYGRFMLVAKDQVAHLGGAAAIEKVVGTTALKALDEYNYCVAQGWVD